MPAGARPVGMGQLSRTEAVRAVPRAGSARESAATTLESRVVRFLKGECREPTAVRDPRSTSEISWCAGWRSPHAWLRPASRGGAAKPRYTFVAAGRAAVPDARCFGASRAFRAVPPKQERGGRSAVRPTRSSSCGGRWGRRIPGCGRLPRPICRWRLPARRAWRPPRRS